MNNTGVIDQFLNVFTQYIDSGFGLVGGDVRWLSTTLIAIDMTLAGLFWAMAGEDDILARLIKKTLYVGFFAFVIGNFNSLCKIVYQSFSGLGLEAAGSTLSAQTLLQPGKLAQVGIDAGKPILAAASSLTGYVSIVTNAIPIFVLLVAWVVVVLSFFVLAIQLFIVLLEFKLTTLAGFVLIPFALFNKTAFLAEKVLGNVVASGVKILVLAVIVGIGSTLFSQFTQGFGSNQPTIEDALSIMLGALSLFGLGVFGPGIATGLVSGAPQLGAGAAVGTALTAGGLGAAAALGAGAAIGAAGSGLGAAARGASRLSGSAAVPATAAASNSMSPSGPPAWAQRLQRGARHASRAALHVIRSEGQAGANSVSLDQEDRR
ncbi:MAG TPA: P-type conjugative transfer protein TrbL [Bradyrhizobium sp.]|uniref:P-type conjugative transfer protein TrbL n=1 Tax=Bradyrhizobium sp. TaxID=376 RepID=UPI002CB06CCC|nr:P-type conjugative transfer protein TrbL [Bradyrhizobium sp.]HLZ06847.1 P-type conjugative transfer protein TrbL [Bradyrhizobium sp.]